MTASPETAGRWFYVHEGLRKGPVDNAELVALILDGEIPESTLIWRPGLDEWAPASRVDEIRHELPPPIPVGDGSAAERDALGEAGALAEGLEGTDAGDESSRSGERRRRRHRSTRYRIARARPRWLLPLIVMVLVVIVVLWYLLRRVNEVPPGRIILEGAVWDDTSAPSRRPPASPG